MAREPREQEARGPFQANVKDASVRKEITDALTDFGFSPPGRGLRLLLLVFARSAKVRAAVKDDLHLATLTPVGER